MPEPPGLVAGKELVQELAPLVGSPAACLHPGSLWGCWRVLQERFGPDTAALRSPQQAKVSASSRKGLGNPTWEGLGCVSLRHPTETAAWLGVAARCGVGGFSGAPRAPCTLCNSSSCSRISLL